MRQSVFARFFGFLGLYFLIFVALVSLQFSKNGTFSLSVFNLLVEGSYRVPGEGEIVPYQGASPLSGDLTVVYGGLEFPLPGDSRPGNGLYLLDETDNRQSCFPQYMAVEEAGIRFYLSGGADIFFTTGGEGTELQISGNFDGDTFMGLEIPYRLLKNPRLPDAAVFAGGRDYRVNQAAAENRGAIVLSRGGSSVSYGLAGERREWRAEDYILEEGKTVEAYRAAVARWVDKNYDTWGRLVPSRNEEDMVIAYGGEALLRGVFKEALTSASRVFTSGSRQAYESSVYMGGMNTAYQGLVDAETEQLARIMDSLARTSPDLFTDDNVFEFLRVRGQEELLNRGITLMRGMNSPALAQLPGLLEAQVDLLTYRPQALGGFFASIAARQQDILSAALRYIVPGERYHNGLVLAFGEDKADVELNLRLGKALTDWGEATGQEPWAAIGRSLVLSVLSLEGGEGKVVSALIMNSGEIFPDESRAYISTARLYRLLKIGGYRPKLIALGPEGSGLWAWTASPDIRLTQEDQVLDIAVEFPAGESHYILIRGISPFYRLQFYETDWRSDPNFERYDSSGWVYHSQERILALKVKHRTAVEHVKIYLGLAPPAG
ncbi:MAG: hypothetical protein LBP20_01885 [Treponema sp.]|jgi:hypothetical protein|nr:hypothetical protein [Treponema sp.]